MTGLAWDLVKQMPTADSSSATTVALLRLGSARDADAWSWLIERHGDCVRRLAYRLIRDPAMAEDAAQEAFLALRDSAPRFTPAASGTEAAATGWLMRVSWTAITKTARNRRRRTRHEQPIAGDRLSSSPEPGSAAAERERDEADVQAMAAELERLPERYRQPLILHFQLGLDYPTLAGTLGISVNAARVRVHRAVAALRVRLSRARPALGAGVIPWFPLPAQAEAARPLVHQRLQRLLASHGQGLRLGRPPHQDLTTWGLLAGCAALALLLPFRADHGNGGQAPGAALRQPVGGAAPPLMASAAALDAQPQGGPTVDPGHLDGDAELPDATAPAPLAPAADPRPAVPDAAGAQQASATASASSAPDQPNLPQADGDKEALPDPHSHPGLQPSGQPTQMTRIDQRLRRRGRPGRRPAPAGPAAPEHRVLAITRWPAEALTIIQAQLENLELAADSARLLEAELPPRVRQALVAERQRELHFRPGSPLPLGPDDAQLLRRLARQAERAEARGQAGRDQQDAAARDAASATGRAFITSSGSSSGN